MSKPKTILWEADEHTLAKHKILRGYLDAWFPIMSRWEKRLLLIDGFAGPGRYLGGEEGSPLLMLKALLDHRESVRLRGTSFSFLFVEQDADRVANLQQEIDKLKPLPVNVTILGPYHANFSDVMADLLRDMKGKRLIPTFAFLDPFGYSDTAVGLTGQMLRFPKCEVLIYVPLYNIARFVGEPGQEAVLNSLYGSDAWKAARDVEGFEAKQDVLHDLFADALREHTTHVRSFEMLGKTTNSGYHLFFGTSDDQGLRQMKTAMWKADPEHGLSFKDSTNRGQSVLFSWGPDLRPLLGMLEGRFGDREFTIEEAERFVLVDTPFRDDAHLKGPTLKPAEAGGLLEAWKADGSARKSGTYPAGTVLRFKSPGAQRS